MSEKIKRFFSQKKILQNLGNFLVLLLVFFFLQAYLKAYPHYGIVHFLTNKIEAFQQIFFHPQIHFDKNLWLSVKPFFATFIFTFGLLYSQRKKISFIKTLGIIFLSLVFFAFILLWVLKSKTPALEISWVLSISKNIMGPFLGSFLFLLLTVLVGKCFFRVDKNYSKNKKHASKKLIESDGVIFFLFYFFIGFIVLSSFLFILVKLKLFHFVPWVLSLLFLILIVFCPSHILAVLKKSTQKFSLDRFGLSVLSLGIAFLSFSFWQGFVPFSFGWDSMTHYLLTIKDLILFDTLRSGIFPYFLEIYLASFGKFFGLSGVNFLLIILGAFFPFIFYLWGRTLRLEPKINQWLAVLLWTTPVMVFQLSKDIKIDSFFVILLMTSAIAWGKNFRKLSLFFLGFAPLIKLTAIGFFPLVSLIIMIQLYQESRLKVLEDKDLEGLKNGRFKSLFLEIFIAGFILVLPLMLWTSINIYESGTIPTRFSTLKFQVIKSKSVSPIFNDTLKKEIGKGSDISVEKRVEKSVIQKKPTEIKKLKNISPKVVVIEEKTVPKSKTLQPASQLNQKISPTGFEEEAARYKGFHDNFFQSIWAIFTSPQIPIISKEYVDLGFLWLFFGVISMFYFFVLISKKLFPKTFKERPHKKSQNLSQNLSGEVSGKSCEGEKLPLLYFFILSVGFFFFWIEFGQGIAWYGLPFLGLVYLIFGYFYSHHWIRSMRIISLFFITLGLMLNIFSALLQSREWGFFSSIFWAKNPNKTTQEVLENQFYSHEKKAAAILNQNAQTNILRIGTMVKYWLKNADQRMIEDPQMDLLYRLLSQYSDGEVRTLLKQNNIGYVVLDLGTVSIETDREGSLHRKFETVQRFLESHKTKIIPQLEISPRSRIQIYKIKD